jgi:hypothetical protein
MIRPKITNVRLIIASIIDRVSLYPDQIIINSKPIHNVRDNRVLDSSFAFINNYSNLNAF